MASKKSSKKTTKPEAWQLDPETLQTERVQYWSRDGVLVGMVPLARARELVVAGSAFACSDQHVCAT